MALFDVPGWSVPAEPAQVAGKRKRPSGQVKVPVPEVNLDQLVKKLKVSGSKADANGTCSVDKGKTKRKRRVGHSKSGGDEESQRAKDSTLLKPQVSGSATEDGRKRQRISSSSAPKAISTSPEDDESTKRLTAMQKGMKHSLDGARFRYVHNLHSRR
jgi:ribosomal RNA-processing protein 8